MAGGEAHPPVQPPERLAVGGPLLEVGGAGTEGGPIEVLVPLVVEANLHYDMPTAAQMILWPASAAALALALIQPMKGAVIALIWAR